MDQASIVTIAGIAAGMVGSVLVWLVKIEHRLTRLETTITERLPVRTT
jgi:hypothetical protein